MSIKSSYSIKELRLFSLLFSLLFFSNISLCSTLLKTIQMLFEVVSSKFNAKELIQLASILGPLCFCLFMILIVFISMNMFISIINDNYHRAVQNQEHDEELFSFMLKKFLLWIGLKKLTTFETAELVGRIFLFSNPLLSINSLKRFERRGFNPLLSNRLNNDIYKRNPVAYRRTDVFIPVGRRGVVPTGTALWPGGALTYDISNIGDDADRENILQSMKMITEDTAAEVDGEIIPCITFTERNSDDETYITFNYADDGCYTNGLGYLPGNERTVNLQKDGCFGVTTIQHEIMHVLGFDHEHKRTDRDDYVNVALDKIAPDWLAQYQKYGEGTTVDLLTPYDVNSIMHYYPSEELQSKEGVGEIKRLGRLSPIDVREVRTLYQCQG